MAFLIVWLGIVLLQLPIVLSQLVTFTGSDSEAISYDNALPTGPRVTYVTYDDTQTLSQTSNSLESSLDSVLFLNGGNVTATAGLNGTTTSTASLATQSNTQPCNQYVEFCERKYSNITYVAAHNFAFAKQGNVQSNQLYNPTQQLNDGIRMLQGQTRYVNNTVYYCHTSCDLLNAGTALSIFEAIAEWVESHPYDVISILIGNGDFIDAGNFTSPIIDSGLGKYVYTPPVVPMTIDEWPTLSQMILRQTRVVIFMDYEADQTRFPYILDEFSQLWETPFSPTDPTFPCNVQRPPDLAPKDARNRLYMANHNLNVEASLLGTSILVPNTVALNQTNAVSGESSLGEMSNTCSADWGRPPNFLLVDYYNAGNYPGSVFEVAAIANGVEYNRSCCGSDTSDAPRTVASDLHHIRLTLAVWISVIFTIQFI